MRIVDRVNQTAQSQEAKLGQIALAWLLHQDDDIVSIPSTKRRAYFEENAATSNISLSAEESVELDRVAPVGETVGDLNAPQIMSLLDR